MSGQIDIADTPRASQPVIHRLAALLSRPVPADLRARAALHLLDWTGCAVAGAASPVPGTDGRPFAGVLADAIDGDGGPCRAIGRPGTLAAEQAARWNGALGTVLEMDDLDKRARLHPGPVVIPAALALAQATGADGPALLDAIVRGYEVTVRLGRALGTPHYRHWHSTATCGTLGAAAACASLLRLDGARMAQALALAATRTGGLWETRNDPSSAAKALHTAQAAGDGLFAARAAGAGLCGPARILEGAEGLFAATAPGSDPEALFEGADDWMLPAISFKPWPACRHAHPAIDAALGVLDRLGVDRLPADAITAVRVDSYADALRFCDQPDPRTVGQAKFSLQHAVAVTLTGGPPPLSAFDPLAIAEAETAHLRARVTVAEATRYSARYPAHFGASLLLRLANGWEVAVDVPDALGDPENPLDAPRLRAKAEMLCQAGGMAAGAVTRLLDAALAVGTDGPAPYLTALPGGGAA